MTVSIDPKICNGSNMIEATFLTLIKYPGQKVPVTQGPGFLHAETQPISQDLKLKPRIKRCFDIWDMRKKVNFLKL